MAIYVDKKLAQLGAKRIHPLGLGDDDANLEDDFITWKELFWQSACSEFNLELVSQDFSMRQYEQTILHDGDYNPDRVYSGEPYRIRSLKTQRPPFDIKNPYMAPIRVNKNLHSNESDRCCMHIELDIKIQEYVMMLGTMLRSIQNDDYLVHQIGSVLNVDLDTVFTMRATDEDAT